MRNERGVERYRLFLGIVPHIPVVFFCHVISPNQSFGFIRKELGGRDEDFDPRREVRGHLSVLCVPPIKFVSTGLDVSLEGPSRSRDAIRAHNLYVTRVAGPCFIACDAPLHENYREATVDDAEDTARRPINFFQTPVFLRRTF